MLRLFASKYNGQIKVKNFFWQKSVWAGGVEQSGPLVRQVWLRALNSVTMQQCNNVLILGLGCGTAAKLISKKYPGVKMTGVEIDPVIIEIGKKYFGLDRVANLKIVVGDARKYHPKEKFDLVLADAYIGERAIEVKNLKKILCPGGKIIVNKLEPERGYKNTTYVVEY